MTTASDQAPPETPYRRPLWLVLFRWTVTPLFCAVIGFGIYRLIHFIVLVLLYHMRK